MQKILKMIILLLVIIQPSCYIISELVMKNMDKGNDYFTLFAGLCLIWLLLIQFVVIKSKLMPTIAYLIIVLCYNIIFATIGQLVFFRWLENKYNYNSGDFLNVIVCCIYSCIVPCIVELIVFVSIKLQKNSEEYSK